jgi:hypothetical protein
MDKYKVTIIYSTKKVKDHNFRQRFQKRYKSLMPNFVSIEFPYLRYCGTPFCRKQELNGIESAVKGRLILVVLRALSEY